MKARILTWVLLISVLTLGSASARYVEGEQRAVEAVKKVKPSVVRIDTTHPASRKPGVGSGIILRKDGFILTNAHVIRNARVVKVTTAGGKTYNAQIWSTSPQYDLAVLKIEAQNLPVPHFGDSNKLDLGQMAIAIGTPLRFSFTVTIGTISAIGRQVQVGDITYRNLIQTDAAINPGSSGGALISSAGDVIGINTLVYTGTNETRPAQGLGFAIPINDALKIAQALVGRSKIAAPPASGPPWLGISGKDVTRDMAQSYDFKVKAGVLVTEVMEGSPAQTAGIKKSDVISDLGGTPVRSVKELQTAVATHKAGDSLDVVVWGGGKARRTVTVKLEGTTR